MIPQNHLEIVETTVAEKGDGVYMALCNTSWRGYDGKIRHREWLRSKMDAAIAIPRTEDGRWVVVREWRVSLGGWCFQFPGGMIDDGEAPVDAAMRECFEETGYRTVSNNGEPMRMATSPGLSGETVWFCRIVVANEPEFVPDSLDEPGTVHAIDPAGFDAFLQSARDAGDHVCAWLLIALPWAE